MKRKPILLLLVVGAALWGVNYRLDHPPLTQADKEFRALVAGADSVWIYQSVVTNKKPLQSANRQVDLNEEQTRELIENLRIGEEKSDGAIKTVFRKQKTQVVYLSFVRNKAPIFGCRIYHNSAQIALISVPTKIPRPMKTVSSKALPTNNFLIRLRFQKRLRRYLQEVLPTEFATN